MSTAGKFFSFPISSKGSTPPSSSRPCPASSTGPGSPRGSRAEPGFPGPPCPPPGSSSPSRSVRRGVLLPLRPGLVLHLPPGLDLPGDHGLNLDSPGHHVHRREVLLLPDLLDGLLHDLRAPDVRDRELPSVRVPPLLDPLESEGEGRFGHPLAGKAPRQRRDNPECKEAEEVLRQPHPPIPEVPDGVSERRSRGLGPVVVSLRHFPLLPRRFRVRHSLSPSPLLSLPGARHRDLLPNFDPLGVRDSWLKIVAVVARWKSNT